VYFIIIYLVTLFPRREENLMAWLFATIYRNAVMN